jgi:hypothetical protein
VIAIARFCIVSTYDNASDLEAAIMLAAVLSLVVVFSRDAELTLCRACDMTSGCANLHPRKIQIERWGTHNFIVAVVRVSSDGYLVVEFEMSKMRLLRVRRPSLDRFAGRHASATSASSSGWLAPLRLGNLEGPPKKFKGGRRTPTTAKMKIKALSRSTSSTQAPGSNVAKVTRNLDPNLHPFERAREYTRALNATKVERMFAQPFLGDFEPGHVDGVYSFAKDPNSLEHFASGSGDGVVKVWDLTSREEKWQAQAHENIVKGMCWTQDKKLITCGADRQIQLFEPYAQPSKSPPKATVGVL